MTLPTITVSGLDYLKIKTHHFKRPMKTKAERNKHLSVKPKFIFHSGQHPTPPSCEESSDKPSPVVQDVSSRGRGCNPNIPLNIQSMHTKRYAPKVSALKVKTQRFNQLAQYLHLKFGCQNLAYIQQTAQLGHIKGIPADIGKYDINCPICKISAATKIPRGWSSRHNRDTRR